MLKFASILFLAVCFAGIAQAEGDGNVTALPVIPASGQITMLNVGNEMCLSCERMASIIKELEREYHGKAAFYCIDLRRHKKRSVRYRLHAIPTQIFYDADGRERFRHEGYLSKKRCISFLKELGVR